MNVPSIVDRAQTLARKLEWVPVTLARLALGALFVSTGWGKVHDLARVAGFFAELGIPLPGLNAVVVSWIELLGGALLVVGLGARLAALPLAGTMLVALVTAKAPDIHGLADLAGTSELAYLVLLLVVAVSDSGPLSLDRAVSRARARRRLAGAPPDGAPAAA